MTEGRTYWYAEDATYLSRALVIELGDEFGPAVVGVLQSIKSHAKLQNDGGRVKTGLATVNRESFAGDADLCRSIIERAAEIGVLDELVWSDARRFKCRVSGWEADQGKGYETVRKRWQRDTSDPADNTDSACPEPRDKSGHGPETGDGVTACPPTGQDRTVNSNVEPARLDEARERLRAEDVQQVFDEWITSTGKTNRTVLDEKRRRVIRKALKAYPLDDVLDAVRGWKLSPHHRGDNATATVYNDLGLLLRDGEHIERFRDLQRSNGAQRPASDPMEAFRRQQARLRERHQREEQGA